MPRAVACGLADGGRDVEQARENALHIPIDHRHGLTERDAGNGAGGIPADAWKSLPGLCRLGKLAAAFVRDEPRGPVQVACPCVVAQPFPEFQDGVLRRAGQGLDGRKRLHEPFKIGPALFNARLLQHDLRDPHGIRMPAAAPGQLAGVARVPRQQRTPNPAHGMGID